MGRGAEMKNLLLWADTGFVIMSMINTKDILETIKMIEEEHLDIRTITMGISLRDLASDDVNVLADKIYDKVTRRAEKLVATGEQIERELGIPIINKRISVTPIAMIGAVTTANSYVPLAKALDRAASATGVNFVGGFSALVQKGFAKGDEILIIRFLKHWQRLIWSARQSTSHPPRRASIWMLSA